MAFQLSDLWLVSIKYNRVTNLAKSYYNKLNGIIKIANTVSARSDEVVAYFLLNMSIDIQF